jgi:APA family basic amino acid/polyamine antiporter
MTTATKTTLTRQVNLNGAVWLGLGSMLGSGVFVAVPQAVEMIGPAALAALVIAGVIATCNGLSSAQLAAIHPVSGGTYEYGHRFFNASFGRCAGWLFLCAKSASAAVAARAATNAILQWLLADEDAVRRWERPSSAVLLLCVTGIVALGIRRTNLVNRLLVTTTIIGLATFCWFALNQSTDAATVVAPVVTSPGVTSPGVTSPGVTSPGVPSPTPDFSWAKFAYTVAFLFVAFTGYGRVATLGEEIQDPKKNVPRAVIVTLAVAIVIYLTVAYSVTRLEPSSSDGTRVLTNLLPSSTALHTRILVSVAALAATAGVLLNLLLGLSRTVLAMARRSDLPQALSVTTDSEPRRAVIAVGIAIFAFLWLDTTQYIWSVSAASVLCYYALTNACALQLPPEQRLLPRSLMWFGLIGCIVPALMVPLNAWGIVAAICVVGLLVSRAVKGVQAVE